MSEIDVYRIQQIIDNGNAIQISLIEDVQTEPLSQKQLITENVAKKLDAERRTSYTLTVSALDQANTGMRKQSSARVRIFVRDVNDNDPKFQFPMQEITYDENQQKGSEVYTVEANDVDSGENGKLASFYLLSYNQIVILSLRSFCM